MLLHLSCLENVGKRKWTQRQKEDDAHGVKSVKLGRGGLNLLLLPCYKIKPIRTELSLAIVAPVSPTIRC